MILKWKLIVFKLFLLFFLLIQANSKPAYSQFTTVDDSEFMQRYMPDYAKLQFAGGIGFMSAGLGYTFFEHKLDVTLFYGYVPKTFTIDDLHSISLQFTVKLLRYQLTEQIEVLPLNVGWFAHHTFGNEYWVKLPDNYPDGYYWWSPGRNAGVFIGAEVKTKLLASKTPASGMAFYWRVGTRGLYLASKVGNSSIPLSDIIEYGFGVAFYR